MPARLPKQLLLGRVLPSNSRSKEACWSLRPACLKSTTRKQQPFPWLWRLHSLSSARAEAFKEKAASLAREENLAQAPHLKGIAQSDSGTALT